MKRKHKRLTFVAIALLLLGAAAALVLSAFEDSIVFFYSPTELAEKNVVDGRHVRIGGLVKEGSIKKGEGAVTLFEVTDLSNTIAVSFTGLLPDLFREGQGVVAEGKLKDGRTCAVKQVDHVQVWDYYSPASIIISQHRQ